MSNGMRDANEALLSGVSAGGLSSILHCDEFRGLFPTATKVKCLSYGGFFLDAVDVSGGRELRDHYSDVVGLQGLCTTSCLTVLFPENFIANITTTLFILNSAYDSWHMPYSLAPPSANPRGEWKSCRLNPSSRSASLMEILKGEIPHIR
ncbi:hypothetical protein ACFX12_010232 [Malus domestica]